MPEEPVFSSRLSGQPHLHLHRRHKKNGLVIWNKFGTEFSQDHGRLMRTDWEKTIGFTQNYLVHINFGGGQQVSKSKVLVAHCRGQYGKHSSIHWPLLLKPDILHFGCRRWELQLIVSQEDFGATPPLTLIPNAHRVKQDVGQSTIYPNHRSVPKDSAHPVTPWGRFNIRRILFAEFFLSLPCLQCTSVMTAWTTY